MSRRFALLLALLLLLLACGCKRAPDRSGLPRLEYLPDGDSFLLEGIRYSFVPHELVDRWNPGRWQYAGEEEEAVASLQKMTIFTIQGDEEGDFLWGIQEGWAPGPFQLGLFLREGRSLELPRSGEEFDLGTFSTRREAGLFGKKSVVTWESDDPELLTALFEAWNTGAEVPPPENREDSDCRNLDLRSAERPWLRFHLECTRYGGQGPVYLTNREGKRTALPEETAAALAWEEPGLWERLFGKK